MDLISIMLRFILWVSLGYISTSRFPELSDRLTHLLVRILLYVLIPLSILSAVISISIRDIESFSQILLFILYHLSVSTLLATAYTRLMASSHIKDLILLVIVNHNGLYLPIAIMSMLYGEKGALMTVIYAEIYFILFLLLFPLITGRKLRDDYYKRDVKGLENSEVYRKVYGKGI